MLFNSFSFLIFFPVVFLTYWALPYKPRRLFLLLASCYFYAALIPKYLIILIVVITTDYFLAFLIDKSEGRKKLLFLLGSISVNIGILFFFKYFNFFNINISNVLQFSGFDYQPFLLHIILPIGLSFHIFQSLSYIVEVYRGKYQPEKNYLTYALYVMFFPQLVAGPIERPENLLPQLALHKTFDPYMARRGLERMLWGFFKKLVIADQIGQVINPLFLVDQTNGLVIFAMAVLFTYQLYCDFSGYTDIALGSAMMLGITLRENFNRPFAARSFADLWRRWHMSLSEWFRDYVYISLGGSKTSKLGWVRNILITFMLSGLWHGANWTFVVWGALNGLYIVIENITKTTRDKVIAFLRVPFIDNVLPVVQLVTVFSFSSLAFLIFRTETIHQAWFMVQHIFSGVSIDFLTTHLWTILTRVSGSVVFLVIVFSIALMEIVQYIQSKQGTFFIFDTSPKIIRYSWYYFLTAIILFFGYFDSQSFIYFQF